ncbi:MAG: hypothetical protein IJN90_00560 [Bacilli bacterium]|nr:hypothetical protein [Bacilli bacterium]
MKVCEFSFRDLDRKWIGIESKKYCKKLAKKIKMRKLLCPIFGYFYIDKENGLLLRVLGNIERDGRNKLYLDNDFIFENELVVDYDFVKKFDVEILDEEVVKNIEGSIVLENKLDVHYKNINNFLDTRNMEELDSFRNDTFVDDVQVLLKNKDESPDELLWARIEGIMDIKPDVLICKLLSSSYYNDEYAEDVMVGVKYFSDDETLRIVGMLKKREK